MIILVNEYYLIGEKKDKFIYMTHDLINNDSVTINVSLDKYGNFSFENVSDYVRENLKSFTIPSKLGDRKVNGLDNYCFSDFTSLENVTFSDGINHILNCSFMGCVSLKKIYLPNSMKLISPSAFMASGLEEIDNLPENMDPYDFIGCAHLKKVNGIDLVDGYTVVRKFANGYRFVEKNGDNNHFKTTISIDDKKEDILLDVSDDGVIRKFDCSNYVKLNLKSFTIPNKIGNIKIKGIGRDLFYNFLGLENIILPNSLVEIGPNVFRNCDNLKKIILPDSLMHIHDCAFRNTGLEEIDIPDSVTRISYKAFGYCYNLKKAKLPPLHWDYFLSSGIDVYSFEYSNVSDLTLYSHSMVDTYEGKTVDISGTFEAGAGFNRESLKKITIIMNHDIDAKRIKILKRFYNLEEVVLVGKVSAKDRILLSTLPFRIKITYKDSLDDIKEDKIEDNTSKENDTVSEILELKKKIIEEVDRLPGDIGNEVKIEMNTYLVEYRKLISDSRNDITNGNYLEYDVDLIAKLNLLLSRISSKSKLVDLVSYIDKLKNDINSNNVEDNIVKEIIDKLNELSIIDGYDKNAILIRVINMLDKYRERIIMDINTSVNNNKEIKLVLYSNDFERELNRELDLILDEVTLEYNKSKDYIEEIKKVKYYRELLNSKDKIEDKGDLIINIIKVIRDNDNLKNEFMDIIDNYNNQLCLGKKDANTLRLELLNLVNVWFNKAKLLIQLDGMYEGNSIRVSDNMDYGMIIGDIVNEINIIINNQDELYKRSINNEISALLEDYRSKLDDIDNLVNNQKMVISKLYDIKSRCERNISINNEFNRRSGI